VGPFLTASHAWNGDMDGQNLHRFRLNSTPGEKKVKKRQAVFGARYGHGNPITGVNQPVLADSLAHLLKEEMCLTLDGDIYRSGQHDERIIT
jgi:hypothetical protein